MESFLRNYSNAKPHKRNPYLGGIPNRKFLNGSTTGLTYEEALTFPNSYSSELKRSPYASKKESGNNERRIVLKGSRIKKKNKGKPKYTSPGGKPKSYLI